MTDASPLPPITEGTLFEGALRFAQPASGYRAAIDGLLLAYFVPPSRRLAVDLGAGAGMVSLAILAHGRASKLLAIERDSATARILKKNLEDNGLSSAANVLVGDVGELARSHRGAADLVVANPPFFRADASTPGGNSHHEQSVRAEDPLGPFVRAARLLLARQGRLCVVFPARDLEVLIDALSSKDLHPRRILFVHPRAEEPANRVLVECTVGRPGGLVVAPPWTLYVTSPDEAGKLSDSALLRAVSRDRPRGLSPRSESD